MGKQTNGCCSCRCFLKLIVFLLICGLISAGVILWDKYTELVPTPVILTSDGPVQGNIKYSRDGQEFWQFLGIPYAKPPIGDLKFKPPVPIESWEDVKIVQNYPPSCAQLDTLMTGRAQGQLDCLYLNVFVSQGRDGNGTKPVLVYIHGGGFMSGGSSMYQPDFFMDQDIVLVVMNYRLGPYGFLNLEDSGIGDKAQGNMGLKDQNLVLKWVNKNIGQFGGDPDKVTIFGESAGGVAVQLHILSEMSNKLFSRAIAQSGSALSPWSFSIKSRDIALEHAIIVGCPVEKDNDLLNCYENMEWEDLVKYQWSLVEPLKEKDMFEPTIDGQFLKERPQDIMRSGKVPAIPIMFGVNSGEGGIRTGRFEVMPELIKTLDANWTDLLANLMILEEKLPEDVAMEIRERYFGNGSFLKDLEGFYQNLTIFISDTGFYDPTHRSAVAHAKMGAGVGAGADVYIYYFNYTSKIFPGAYNAFRSTRVDDWLPAEIKTGWTMMIDWISEFVFGWPSSHKYGVSHGEDAFQMWNIEGKTVCISGNDKEFSRNFIKSIVDFASAKNPLKFGDITWPSINDDLNSGKDEYSIPYMLLDDADRSKVIPEPFGNRLKFWADLRDYDY